MIAWWLSIFSDIHLTYIISEDLTSEWMIKFNGLSWTTDSWDPCNPYKQCYQNLYIRIIIFPHTENPWNSATLLQPQAGRVSFSNYECSLKIQFHAWHSKVYKMNKKSQNMPNRPLFSRIYIMNSCLILIKLWDQEVYPIAIEFSHSVHAINYTQCHYAGGWVHKCLPSNFIYQTWQQWSKVCVINILGTLNPSSVQFGSHSACRWPSTLQC